MKVTTGLNNCNFAIAERGFRGCREGVLLLNAGAELLC